MIRVLIVDDHEMMADGLSAVLGSDERFVVVGVATTGDTAIERVAAGGVDLAVVDFRLPDMDGGEVTVALKRTCDDLRVVLVTASEGFSVVSRAIAAGAEGFVHKSSPITEIVDAVGAVAAGESWFRPETLAGLSETLSAPTEGVGKDLTERELEVLGLLADGATTAAIVDALVLSQHTVRNHIRNVLTKLGAHSKLEAVTIAFRAGIVRVADDDRR